MTCGLDIWSNSINVFHHIDFIMRFVFTIHRFAPFDLKYEKYFQRQKQLHPIIPEQANHLNLNPVSREIFWDSVELWETDVCFLHIQLIGTNVWLPKTHNVPPEVNFESSGSPAKSESWNSPNLHCLAVFPAWQYCLYSQVWWIYEINRFRRLSHAFGQFCHGSCELIYWP